MTRIFLSGASGNVGRTIVRTIVGKEGFQLVGGWCLEAGSDLGTIAGIGELGIKASNDLRAALAESKPDLVIDFSATPVMAENMSVYLDFGLNAVIGTTGLTEDDLAPFKAAVAAKGLRWAVIPNYGLGITLVTDFIKKARAYYSFVSITDRHTNEMANAPSGTAAALAAAAAGDDAGEVKSRESYPGVLGAKICGVPVLAERLPWPGPYSGHTISLARKDEIITIEVQDYTSEIYMDGVFMTAGKIASLPPGSFVRSLGEIF